MTDVGRFAGVARAAGAARAPSPAAPARRNHRRAEYPDQNPVAPEHVARTVFHAMGIDDLSATDREGRPFHLMDEGRPLTELF